MEKYRRLDNSIYDEMSTSEYAEIDREYYEKKYSYNAAVNMVASAVGSVIFTVGLVSKLFDGTKREIVQGIGSGIFTYNFVRYIDHFKLMLKYSNNDSKIIKDEHVKSLIR